MTDPKQMRVTPRILSGFMELLPEDQLEFNKMFDTIRRQFELFGFAPIETPAIELSEILFAKGGGETEKQIYEIARSDDKKLALHFDLTVPLARYVAQHQHDLAFPFRRYQMQKVWRAERAQKGRFREFYQCDIDIIGSYDPTSDAEIPSVIYAVFTALGFDFTIRINNRKILNGFFEAAGVGDRTTEVLRTVDKIDKIGRDGVFNLLTEQGLSEAQANQVLDFIQISGSNEEILKKLETFKPRSEKMDEGVRELANVYRLMGALQVPSSHVKIDLSIARGLDYYTGTVYETILNNHPGIGSVCSGGRYDDLAGYYTDRDLPGVGISIGLTRLFYQLREAGLVKPSGATPAKVLVISMGEGSRDRALEIGSLLRNGGVPTQVYYEAHKIKQQMKYADRIGIPYVAIIGENEVAEGTVTLKNLRNGTQSTIAAAELVSAVVNN